MHACVFVSLTGQRCPLPFWFPGSWRPADLPSLLHGASCCALRPCVHHRVTGEGGREGEEEREEGRRGGKKGGWRGREGEGGGRLELGIGEHDCMCG